MSCLFCRLGQELDLFSINDTAGGGLVFWHPKGGTVGALIGDDMSIRLEVKLK